MEEGERAELWIEDKMVSLHPIIYKQQS